MGASSPTLTRGHFSRRSRGPSISLSAYASFSLRWLVFCLLEARPFPPLPPSPPAHSLCTGVDMWSCHWPHTWALACQAPCPPLDRSRCCTRACARARARIHGVRLAWQCRMGLQRVRLKTRREIKKGGNLASPRAMSS